ncbi:MAG TPA: hypothetical protein VGM81_25105 [Burkholderiaceae bacterium]
MLVADLNAAPLSVASLIHVFAGGPKGAGQYDCPDAGTNLAARCANYVDLRTGLPLSWPLAVSQTSISQTIVGMAMDPRLQDIDGDSVADANDLCPATPAGLSVDERGCSYAQRHVNEASRAPQELVSPRRN